MNTQSGQLQTVIRQFHVSVPEDYRQACRLLDIPISPETLLGGSYTLAACFCLIGCGILSLDSGMVVFVIGTGCLAAGIGSMLAGRYGVPLAAHAKRIRALGSAPSVVGLLVLGMTLWPSPERAASFAAAAGTGRLADSLETHCRRARRTPRTGLAAFGREWDGSFPALSRALRLLERAGSVPADERESLLVDARTAVLAGTREEMASFAADLRAPATALYAFGVLLPLALVALIPAIGAAGIPVTESVIVVSYGIVLPGGVVVGSAWLLAQRPVAFPPATIPRDHPDVSTGRVRGMITGFAAGIAAWGVGTTTLPTWAPPVAALGIGVGAALVVHYRPVTDVRERIDATESGVPDALSAIGRHLDRGESVENALEKAVTATADPISSVLDETIDRQRTLGLDIESAFCGEYGTLSTVPSPRLQQAAVVLDAASEIGPPAGETLIEMGNHLEELDRVERDTRRQLAQITGTLSNTAGLFGPLVGGTTVALSSTMGHSGPVESISTAMLGPVVGWYCLVLAAVLTALSTGLNRGLDRALVGYRIGLALCSATAVYCVAAVATDLFV